LDCGCVYISYRLIKVVDGVVEKRVLVRMTVSLSAGQSQGLRGRIEGTSIPLSLFH
jgi:hypothetical protein